MANEKKRVDSYLDTVSRLEPDIVMIDAGAGWASIAISLKRIADALQPQCSRCDIRTKPPVCEVPGCPIDSIPTPPSLTNEDFIAAARHLSSVTNAPADHAAETVRVVFQAVRWAREGREPPREGPATMDHAGMPEDDPLATAPFAELEKVFNETASLDPLDVAARAIMEIDRNLNLNIAEASALADAAIRAYEAIPDSYWTKERAARDPSIRPEPIINYAAMPPAEMLARVGADAMKWAEAFCQTAYKLGIVIDDEAWMAGWFANAIEAGAQRERDKQLPGPVES